MKKLLIILAAAIALSASAIETTIAYQGVLRDAQGHVLTVHAQTITFRLYSQASGGTPLWARAIAVNLDNNGLFNVELSDAGTSVEGATYETLAEALKAARSGALFVGKATISAVEVTGGLTVDGSTTLAGNTTFNNNVTVLGGITVKDTGSFKGYGTIPVGGIIMWSGTTVPDGWALCNGQKSNGVQTPNLCNRFIVGSGIEYNVGATGGAKEVTLTESQMPKHRHYYTGDDQLWSAHDGSYDIRLVGTVGGYDAKSETEGGARVYQTSGTGGNQAHENRPPYYALAFIMRVK